MRVLSVLLAGLLLLAIPSAAQAASVRDAERLILDWVNQEREARGLEELRGRKRLWDLAGDRARGLASANLLSHSVPGSIPSQLNARDFPWRAYGEDIGYSPQKNVVSAAKELFRLWKASPSHWKLMMSDRYNYMGAGLAYRSSNQRWYASLVFTESPDMTKARATMLGASRDGDDVTWTWRGWDPVLQVRTAGLDDYEVQLRTGSGPWKTLTRSATSTSKTLRGLRGGRWYSLRVAAADRRGNQGPFTSGIRVWVP